MQTCPACHAHVQTHPHLGPPVQACRAEEGCRQAGAPRVDQGLPKVFLGHAVRQGGQPSRLGLRSKTRRGSEKRNDLPKIPPGDQRHSWAGTLLICSPLRPGFDPWVGKIPWRRERLPTPVFWPREFHGLYSPWGRKESDVSERLHSFISWHSGPLHPPRPAGLPLLGSMLEKERKTDPLPMHSEALRVTWWYLKSTGPLRGRGPNQTPVM